MHNCRRLCGAQTSAGLIGLLAAVAASFGVSAQAQVPDVPGWELVWQDEFEGTTLDNTKWEAINRRDSFNNEKQYYHPNQVSVFGGNLQITAVNVPRDGKAYQSGLVVSRAIYGPGRYEARVYLPTSQGMWPAFWLNPNQVQWPLGGEIDILENRGSQPFLTSSAYHWQTNPGPCCGQHQYVYDEYTATEGGVPVNFHAGYHTFAVEWDAALLRFYVDGNLHFAVTENGNRPIYETQKNMILNLAVGGDFGGDPNGSTIWPQTMYVDYVRMWHRQTGLAGDYDNDGQVTASDYTLWQDSFGKTGVGQAADGSGNGTIDMADYLVWKNNFGHTAGSGAVGAEGVPEPHSIWLLFVAAASLPFMRCWSR